MDRRSFLVAAGTLAAGLGLPGKALSAAGEGVLPPPATPGGKTLEEALRARQSRREFDGRPLADDVLSGLLWAAWGVNRPETGKRTAPSAQNRQEIDIYVAKADGLYRYEAKEHALTRRTDTDLRAATGRQPYVAGAPVNLVYVADMAKAAGASAEEKLFLAAADTGFISQNVYLYCAAMDLATVVRASIDLPALAKAMGLAEGQRIILAQSVGYPRA